MGIKESIPHQGFLSWLEWGEHELPFLDSRDARLECEEILKELSGLSRSGLYLTREAFDPRLFSDFKERIQERKNRVPLAYVLKKVGFWESELEIRPGVFIPRPETEILIESFIEEGGFKRGQEFIFLDLGTGSGNIAVTLAGIFKKARGLAADLSPKALELGEKNAAKLGVRNQLCFLQADGLKAFNERSFDVIFCNPPYVSSAEMNCLAPEVEWEPRQALEAGKDGIDFYRRIFNTLSPLKKGGSLWLEVGWNQSGAVRRFFEQAGFGGIRTFKDLNGINRVVRGMNYHG